MFRVTLSVLAAAAAIVASAGAANAQCCANTGIFASGWAGSGCCNSGYASVGVPVVVQAAPIVVQAAPVVVQQPVLVQQPVMVQQVPVVQQYMVNQGPVYSGPGTVIRPAYYNPPRAIGAYPYAGYRRAGYAPRPYWRGHRYHPHHPYHGAPISRYN